MTLKSKSLLIYLLIFITCVAPLNAQQQSPTPPQRERRVQTAPPSTSTPSPTQTATPQTPAPANANQTPLNNSAPNNSAPNNSAPNSSTENTSASNNQTAPPPQTLAELQMRIAGIANRPAYAHAATGVKIVSLDTGKVIYETNAEKLLLPASNMKLYTAAAALVLLSPDFRFITSVYAAAKPDAATGTVRGDLILYGRGDPTFAARFNNDNFQAAVDDFASRIVAAGVRKVEGNLIGDESFFSGAAHSAGWEWDDLQWYYGAEISALSVNDNAMTLRVQPAARTGEACIVTTQFDNTPIVARIAQTTFINTAAASTASTANITVNSNSTPSNVITNNTTSNTANANVAANNSFAPSSNVLKPAAAQIENRAVTTARGTTRTLTIYRPVNSNIIEIYGALPIGDSGFSGDIALTNPALAFASLVREALEKRGVVITGKTSVVTARNRQIISPVSSLVEITNRPSLPLSLVLAQTLKPSQNLYTELVLRALGAAAGAATIGNPNSQATSLDAGISAVQSFLRIAVGIDEGSVINTDASGLSRGDYVTANSTVRLLEYMDKQVAPNIKQAFYNAQPIAGVDGTLRNRMKGTPAAGNVRAKTGTLNNATSLSGYVTTAAGERLAFSIMINNFPASVNPRQEFTDPIAVLLASFAGRS